MGNGSAPSPQHRSSWRLGGSTLGLGRSAGQEEEPLVLMSQYPGPSAALESRMEACRGWLAVWVLLRLDTRRCRHLRFCVEVSVTLKALQ